MMRALFVFLAVGLPLSLPSGVLGEGTGAVIYRKECASCHGERGEGVEEEYDEPLWGKRSPASLARYIERRMPEEEEERVAGADATAVAQYIYEAFYSPAARERMRPARIELTRLTNDQYRQSVADLVGSFSWEGRIGPERGLKARYFNSEKMAKEKKQVLERIDPHIDFDFGAEGPGEGVTAEAFSIRWEGSLIAPDTGLYAFRLRTRNGATLSLNSFGNDRRAVLIDAYVSSGNKVREETGHIFLLGGRAYPLRLMYFSYQEESSSIRLDWKPPRGVWEPVPGEALTPNPSPRVTVVDTKFPPDDRSRGYERGTSISKEWQEATTMAAIGVANHVLTHLQTIAGINGSQRRDPARMKQFCGEFAERAFRRPLSDEQKEFFITKRFGEQSDPEVAAKHAILLILTSPRFLYPGLAENRGAPDGYTRASRLALALWDSLPDKRLREAARQGKLGENAQLARQARRMMDDPRAKVKMRAFFYHWLALDEREDLRKDPQLFPGFDERLVADLRRSLNRFFDEVMWSDTSDYRELLRADYLFLNGRLAAFYGAGPPEGASFRKTPLPGGHRSGVLTHPYLLSAFAYHNTTSPIHRGVYLGRNVLGRLLKPPPKATVFKNDEFDPNLTMREKVTQLTKREACMHCHVVINPVGFSLESFDAVGRFRTSDRNGKPIDTASEYLTTDDEPVRVSSAADLAELAIGSDDAQRAFITQLFHHLVKQPVGAYGPDTLETLQRDFRASGYNMRQLLVDILQISTTES